MLLYNSMTRKKEEFKPIVPGKVSMYSCGPTVYNFFHIGNARPFITFDVLRRYFEYLGYDVTFVQNFTDIDDKVIGKANEEGVTYDQIAARYIEEYYKDAQGLGIRRATVHPKATDNIEAIQDIISKLVDKGYAYAQGGDVYYRTRKFKDYGKLSHQPIDELESGARIDVNEQKEDPLDFALWKGAKPGEPAWDSPWGKGRPGWHIECSAMACRYLGETIDIHSGGIDLCFPHHENEIAQSEAASGKPFANYWLHNAFLTIDNQKMSKSAGNFFMVRDAAEAYGYLPIRFFMLSAHYRSPLNYSAESLEQAKAALSRLQNAAGNLEFALKNAPERPLTAEEAQVVETLPSYRERFKAAMDDDLNTADAIAVLFDLVRAMNTAVVGKEAAGELCRAGLQMLHELADVLGLLPEEEQKDLDAEVEAMIEARQAARKAKNFAEADRIRDALGQMGIVLEDTREGVKWSRKH